MHYDEIASRAKRLGTTVQVSVQTGAGGYMGTGVELLPASAVQDWLNTCSVGIAPGGYIARAPGPDGLEIIESICPVVVGGESDLRRLLDTGISESQLVQDYGLLTLRALVSALNTP